MPVTTPVRTPTHDPRHPHRSSALLMEAGVLLAMLAGLAAVISGTDDNWLCQVDERIISFVARRRTTALVRAAHAVSALAEPAMAATPLAAAALLAARRDGWLAASKPVLTVLAGMTVRRRLAKMIARPRPPAGSWLIEPEGFSFPSKHTTLAALTAGACALAVGSGKPASDRAIAAAAASVGVSRICLGVHWPTDVLAGWLFASAWLDVAQAFSVRKRESDGWPGVAGYQSATAPRGRVTGRMGL